VNNHQGSCTGAKLRSTSVIGIGYTRWFWRESFVSDSDMGAVNRGQSTDQGAAVQISLSAVSVHQKGNNGDERGTTSSYHKVGIHVLLFRSQNVRV
jgi:hypothetical protein